MLSIDNTASLIGIQVPTVSDLLFLINIFPLNESCNVKGSHHNSVDQKTAHICNLIYFV